MFGNNQSQNAGDNSQQVQANTVNIINNNGISEQRAREICAEVFEVMRRDMTREAWDCANKRVKQFEDCLLPKFLAIEGAVKYFADPEFQLLLSIAQKSAAVTDCEDDYDMLAELLKCHIEKGTTKKNRVGISGAVEMIYKIDSDALCALTVMYFLQSFVTTKPLCSEGLRIFSETFDKLLYTELPTGESWLDHLDILKAIRINNVLSLNDFRSWCSSVFDGYTSVGIEKGSSDYNKALDLLGSINLDKSFLISNEYLTNYVKLPVACKGHLKFVNLGRNETNNDILNFDYEIDQDSLGVLEQIWNLYVSDNDKKNAVTDAFFAEWDSYPSLKKVHEFYNNIPYVFFTTRIGKVLAYTNAKRCDSSIPDLLLD